MAQGYFFPHSVTRHNLIDSQSIAMQVVYFTFFYLHTWWFEANLFQFEIPKADNLGEQVPQFQTQNEKLNCAFTQDFPETNQKLYTCGLGRQIIEHTQFTLAMRKPQEYEIKAKTGIREHNHHSLRICMQSTRLGGAFIQEGYLKNVTVFQNTKSIIFGFSVICFSTGFLISKDGYCP